MIFKKKTLNTFKSNFPKLVYLHVPKSGGRSIEQSIKNEYLGFNRIKNKSMHYTINSQNSAFVGGLIYNLNFEEGDINNNRNLKFNRDLLAYKLLDKKIKFISGHFPFDNLIYNFFADEFDFFTTLRDPVQKWLSNFFFRNERQPIIMGKKFNHWKINVSLEDYLKSDRGHYHGYDYSKYYGGLRQNYDYNSKEAINNAKKNLNKFKIIGFLEDLNSLKISFYKTYNFNISIPHKNKSKSRINSNIISDDIINEIKSVCKTDIEIYNFAKELVNSNNESL